LKWKIQQLKVKCGFWIFMNLMENDSIKSQCTSSMDYNLDYVLKNWLEWEKNNQGGCGIFLKFLRMSTSLIEFKISMWIF